MNKNIIKTILETNEKENNYALSINYLIKITECNEILKVVSNNIDMIIKNQAPKKYWNENLITSIEYLLSNNTLEKEELETIKYQIEKSYIKNYQKILQLGNYDKNLIEKLIEIGLEKEKIIDLKETIRKNAQGKNYTDFINYMEENNISFSSPITIKEYLEKVFFDINDHLFIKNIEEIIPILEEYLKKEKIKINQVSLLGEGEYKKVLKVGNYAFKIGYENEVNEIPEDELILKPIMKKNVSKEKTYAIYVGIQPLLNDKWYLNLTDEEIENKLYEIYKTLKDKGINWVDIKKENIGKKDEKLYIIDDDYIYTNTKDITLSPKRYIEYTDRYYKEKVRK